MKVYYPKEYFNFSSELILLLGELSKLPKENLINYNHKNINRLEDAYQYTKNNIYYSSVKDCDIMCLPYKFKGIDDPILLTLSLQAKMFKKPLLIFYNDDDDRTYNLDDYIDFYRTSFYKFKKLINEFALPPFFPDNFKNNILINPKLSIGYCGHINHGRDKFINILNDSDLECNFIIRSGFWAPNINKNIAIKEFHQNMEDNLYIFCYRGAGNFSYRFYQTLMMGRIPILIDSDHVLPFEESIDYSKHCILIKYMNDKYIHNLIKEWHNKNKDRLKEIQLENRKLWEEYLSGKGFIKSIIEKYMY